MIIGIVVAVVLLVWLTIYFFPVSKSNRLHAFEKGRPLVIAHQGGSGLAPTSTLPAFINSKELGVDCMELDIHMTKDGHLVTIHDPTVDRTTNGSGRINDMTLQEVQSLDAGANFQDLNGNYSYHGQGVFIPTLEEVFEAMDDPGMLYIIELKDTNDSHLYGPIAEKLWKTVKAYGLEKNAILASFDQKIVDMVSEVSGGQAIVSGGRQEVTKFVVYHKAFLNGLYRPKVDAFQIPTHEGKIELDDKKLIRGAHKRGMQIHYWTINDKKTMKELLDLGADGIITDRPDLLLEVMEEGNWR